MAYATGQLLGPILAGTLRVQLGARVGWDDVAFWEHQCLFFFFFFAMPMGAWSGTPSHGGR